MKECPHFLLPSTCRQSFLLPLSLPSRRGREVPSSFTSFNVRSLTYSFILPSPMVRGLLPTSFFTGPQPPTVSNDGSHFNRSCTTQLPQRSFTIQSTHLISHTSQPPGVLLPGQRRQQRSMPRRRVRLNPLRCILPHSTRCAWNICVAEPSLVLYLSRHRPPVLSAPAEFHTRSPDFALFIHPLHSFVGLHSLLTRSPHSLHLSLALLAHHPRARAPQKPFNPGRRWEIPVLLREQRRL